MKKRVYLLGGFAFVCLIAFAYLWHRGEPSVAAVSPPPKSVAAVSGRRVAAETPALQPRLTATYARLPLAFEATRGQTDKSVKFLSRGSGYTLFLTGDEAVLALRKASPKSKVEGQELVA